MVSFYGSTGTRASLTFYILEKQAGPPIAMSFILTVRLIVCQLPDAQHVEPQGTGREERRGRQRQRLKMTPS